MINVNEPQAELAETLKEHKTNSFYGGNPYNFVLNGELVVDITLGEYRHLVKEVALKEADIKKAETDKYNREKLIKELETENAELKKKLCAYTITYGKMEEMDNE